MNCPWLWPLAQTSTGNAPTKVEQLLDGFNNNPMMGWGIAIFAVVAMAAAAVAKLTGNLDSIIGFVDEYRPKQRSLTEADRYRLRQELIDVVLRQVVTRLENSLHHKIRLDLKRQEERQRVGRRDVSPSVQTASRDAALQRRFQFQPADRLSLIQTLNRLPSGTFEELVFALAPPKGQVPGSLASQGDRSWALLEWIESLNGPGLETLGKVLEMFSIPPPQMVVNVVEEKELTDVSTHYLLRRDDVNGRLLILGEPGAGKTNELLALAKILLQQATASADAPIPVIFELSEWSSKPDETLADWLCEQLQEKYAVPPEVAKDWIEHNQLWPLLDGLDELLQIARIRCVRAIDAFLDRYPATSTVVCCRRQEYEALQERGEYLKHLNGVIYLQSLSDEQIQTYFKVSNRGSLWDIIQNQPELLELARSPLFLLMLVVAYQGQPIHNTDELLDLYIENQLHDLNNQGAYAPGKAPTTKQTYHYLSWLAAKLEEQKMVVFFIDQLQPFWLDRKYDQVTYRLISGLSFGLIGGLSLGLIGGLSLGLIGGLSLGLIGGLISGLGAGLGFSTNEDLISPRFEILDRIQMPNQRIRNAFKRSVVISLALGFSFGLSFGMLGGLVGGLSFGLIRGLTIGLIGGLVGGLSFGLTGVIQYSILRLILYKSGVSPWNYAKFLEHAENHRFVQRTGGQYYFVHNLIHKHFAKYYQPSRYWFIDPKLQKILRRIRLVFASKFFRILVIVFFICYVAVLIDDESPSGLREIAKVLFENAESIAIASAAVAFITEIPDRKKRDQYEAWQVINSAIEQTGSGGRIQALEDLCSDGVDLEGLNAPAADLSGIDLSFSKLNRANFIGTQLDAGKLKYADLKRAKLNKANLSSANLYGADLSHSNLAGADLRNSVLSHTDFSDSVLRGADFTNANLRGADLSRANLTEAILIGADLTEANLLETKLEGANLGSIKHSSRTRWPAREEIEKAIVSDELKRELGIFGM